MKKNRPNIKTYCAKTILLLTLVYIYIPASLQGQTEVSSIKLPSGPQGASVVYDVIHAGNYILLYPMTNYLFLTNLMAHTLIPSILD
jgi:hypothetical protein